jgi:hypothetical protein
MRDHSTHKSAPSALFGKLFGRVGAHSAKRLDDMVLIRSSLLFDSDWYLQTYPDVAKSGFEPLEHYMDIGWREGRDPGPDFATSSYLRANADVARSGVNPLLHYVEFGRSEGRSTADHRPIPHEIDPRTFDFPDPAPVVSFPFPAEPLEPFLEASPPLTRLAEAAARFRVAMTWLSLLSGYETDVPIEELPVTAEQLADAWYVNSALFRTRWKANQYPFFVHAFQCDPTRAGAVVLVGEGLASGLLDQVDLRLANPFFPILFAFAPVGGAPRSMKILAFPSLCRGGAHYPELLAREDEAADPSAASDHFTRQLLHLLGTGSQRAVKQISVDLSGADGTGTLFQSDFQTWLERVARVGIFPAAKRYASTGERYIARLLGGNQHIEREEQVGTLTVGHDMIPTIAALTAAASKQGGGLASVALNGGPSDELVMAVTMPPEIATMIDRFVPPLQPQWPRKPSSGGSGPPTVIWARSKNRLSDAELMTPLSGVFIDSFLVGRQPITWLIDAADGNPELSQIIQMKLQHGAGDDAISFLGRVNRSSMLGARGAFEGPVQCFENLDEAIARSSTPLIGFVGRGVMLHDHRTAALFSCILQDEAVATASCAMIATERRAKDWHASIADAGLIACPTGETLAPAEAILVAAELWRSVYPIARPPKGLWAARTADIPSWIGNKAAARIRGMHFCTSMVTASIIGTPSGAPFVPPVSSRGITARLLYA